MAKYKKFRVLTKTLQIHTVAESRGHYTILLEDAAQQYRASITTEEFQRLLEEWQEE